MERLGAGIPFEAPGAGRPLFCWSRDILLGATRDDRMVGCWDWEATRENN